VLVPVSKEWMSTKLGPQIGFSSPGLEFAFCLRRAHNNDHDELEYRVKETWGDGLAGAFEQILTVRHQVPIHNRKFDKLRIY
jgi:hypothetical protein